MSGTTLQSKNSAENEFAEDPNFEFSDYLVFDEWLEGSIPPPMAAPGSFIQPRATLEDYIKISSQHGENSSGSSSSSKRRRKDEGKSEKKVKDKVAFKTRSDVDIMDDGYRWRKNGKKMVKSSPNPRNYYRCLVDGCPVKKQVERDAEDSTYVITTYEGVHDHEIPQL